MIAPRISFAGTQLTTLTAHSQLKTIDYAFGFDNEFAFDNADDAFAFDNVWLDNAGDAFAFEHDHAFMPYFDHALKVAHTFVIKLTMYLKLPTYLQQN